MDFAAYAVNVAAWVPRLLAEAARVLARRGLYVAREDVLGDLAGQTGITLAGHWARFDEDVVLGFLEDYHRARPFVPPDRLTGSGGAHAHHLVDLDGTLRPLLLADVEQGARLSGALADWGLNGVAPGIPQDVPAPLQGLAQLIAGAKHKSGTAVYALHYPAAQPFVRECQAVLGQSPGVGVHVVSPLRFEGQEVDEALDARRAAPNLAVGVGSMPIVGVSTPASALAGAVTALAEVVGGALVLLRTGTPQARLGLSVNLYPFDMRHGAFVYGTPANMVLTMLEREVNRYLGTEINAKTFSVMAQRPGAQSCALKALGTGLMAAQGRRLFSALGSLSLDEVYSPVQLIFDREILGYVRRTAEMLTGAFDEALLLTDEVLAGQTESFLDADSTLAHFRDLQWDSPIFPTRTLQQWHEAGEPEAHELAVAEVRRLLAGYEYELPAAQSRALDAIYARAQRELVG